jgi:cyclohexanecarboxylate-CoA ligase
MAIDLAAREALRAKWRGDGWYPDLTVGEALSKGAADHGDAQIVFAPVAGEACSATLREIYDAGTVAARCLLAMGVGPGDAVILQAPAGVASTAALSGIWQLGAVAVPLPMSAGQDEVLHVRRETGARLVIDAETQLIDGGNGVVPTVRPAPGDIACILYTSGSTSLPKGVQHSHETLLFGLTIVPADGSTRSLATFPAGHVASLLGLLRPLVAGGTTVVMDRWSARHAVELIERYRITTSAGTPFFLQTLLDEADRSGRDLSSLKAMLCGAAAVPPPLVARALDHGIVSWRTYGSTEHPAISSGGPADPPDKRQFTDGKVSPVNEVRLIDEHGNDVAPGDEGEVVARGPKQFVGYRDSTLDDDTFFDGTWFRTGDLARFDDDGYLVITDRVKDIVIRGGENISAREVEEVLLLHDAVDDAAVVAVKDELWGEVVCAFVVVRPRWVAPPLDDLVAFCLDRGLAKHKAPARLEVVADLPRTSAGKVRKRDLRALL